MSDEVAMIKHVIFYHFGVNGLTDEQIVEAMKDYESRGRIDR